MDTAVRTETFLWVGNAHPQKCPNGFGYRYIEPLINLNEILSGVYERAGFGLRVGLYPTRSTPINRRQCGLGMQIN